MWSSHSLTVNWTARLDSLRVYKYYSDPLLLFNYLLLLLLLKLFYGKKDTSKETKSLVGLDKQNNSYNGMVVEQHHISFAMDKSSELYM